MGYGCLLFNYRRFILLDFRTDSCVWLGILVTGLAWFVFLCCFTGLLWLFLIGIGNVGLYDSYLNSLGFVARFVWVVCCYVFVFLVGGWWFYAAGCFCSYCDCWYGWFVLCLGWVRYLLVLVLCLGAVGCYGLVVRLFVYLVCGFVLRVWVCIVVLAGLFC